MKSNQFKFFLKIQVVIMATTLFYGCVPGGGSSTRKKMPEFVNSQSLEGAMPFQKRRKPTYGAGSFAFMTSNVDMTIDGNTRQFVSVPLPDQANDSLAISLVNSFKPFALPLLSAWAQHQKQGVVLDLSSHEGLENHRTDYVIEKAGDFSIPVVIIWDQLSAARVASLKTLVEDVPLIKFSCTSGYDPASNTNHK